MKESPLLPQVSSKFDSHTCSFGFWAEFKRRAEMKSNVNLNLRLCSPCSFRGVPIDSPFPREMLQKWGGKGSPYSHVFPMDLRNSLRDWALHQTGTKESGISLPCTWLSFQSTNLIFFYHGALRRGILKFKETQRGYLKARKVAKFVNVCFRCIAERGLITKRSVVNGSYLNTFHPSWPLQSCGHL